MKLDYWFLDAFTQESFKGNPTVVIVTDTMLDPVLMQQLASEFNLSETVFVSQVANSQASLKWFTPSHEVQLCGHGTLSAAHILFEQGLVTGPEIRFETLSGELVAHKHQQGLLLSFPRIVTQSKPVPAGLNHAVGTQVIGFAETAANDGYWVAEVDSSDLSQLDVDLASFSQLYSGSLVVTTALANQSVALRYFAPNHGIDEDPVTGSANVVLADYWQQARGWNRFDSLQQSARTGTMQVECLSERVQIIGAAKTLAQGVIQL